MLASSIRRPESCDVLLAVLGAAVLARVALPAFWSEPWVGAWTTVFVAICLQGAPFVALGVAVAVVLGLTPTGALLRRVVPRRVALAVPTSAALGALLPGCECGSVPAAGGLARAGLSEAAAVSFMLAAPAINPVVLAATASAFPRHPELMLARLVASFASAVVVGWCWARAGRPLRARTEPHDHGRHHLVGTAAADLTRSLGMLSVGAACAATVQTVLPQQLWQSLAHLGMLSVLVLASLAVVVAVCSSADAFLAASFVRFSATAQLAFMVVGPMVDVKLIAMHRGIFGAAVARRLGPLVFAVGVCCATVAGSVLL